MRDSSLWETNGKYRAAVVDGNLGKQWVVRADNLNLPAIACAFHAIFEDVLNLWDVPTRFRDIVENGELFGDNIIDFEYNLFDVNNKYSKEELIKNKSITSVIFLLDQKVEPREFLDRIETIALFFDSLNEKEFQVLKHWIENSVGDILAKEAVKILSSSKEEVESMVASNAFIITDMEKHAQENGGFDCYFKTAAWPHFGRKTSSATTTVFLLPQGSIRL